MPPLLVISIFATIIAAFAFIAAVKKRFSVSDYEEYCFLRGAGLMGPLVSIFLFSALSSKFGLLGEVIAVFACAILSIVIGGLNILLKVLGQRLSSFFECLFHRCSQ